MSNPRFPIGEFVRPERLSDSERLAAISKIGATPAALRAALDGMSDAQLDSTYREGSWTLRQVIHHLADSHVNSYTRFRLALTENNPRIKAYDEKGWAELEDARTMPIDQLLAMYAWHGDHHIAHVQLARAARQG